MSQRHESNEARSAHDVEIYPVRIHERQPNFILLAVLAFAIFLMITSYFGK